MSITQLMALTGGLNYNKFNGFDISTLTEESVTTMTEDNGSGRGVYISPDGYHLYLFNRAGLGSILQYYLSTPFYPSSHTYVRSEELSFAPGSTGMTFSNDGTKVAVCGSTTDDVRYATLSTAWDVSTVGSFTVAQSSFNLANLGTIQFINDGQYFFRGSTGGSSYKIFELASAYDLASAPTAEYGTTASGVWMCIKKDGTQGVGLYNPGSTTSITEHTYSTAYNPSTFTQTDSIAFSSLFTGLTDVNAICSSTEASGTDENKHLYFYDKSTEKLFHMVAS